MQVLSPKARTYTTLIDSEAVSTTRDKNLDFLRGVMLIVMTVDHNEGILRMIFYQTIGFVTAAEGFVYLSGVVFGLVSSKKIANGFECIFKGATKRAAVIYGYHLLIVVLLTMPLWANIIDNEKVAESVFLAPFAADPIEIAFLYAIFLFQPHLLDVLPMYCIFILFAGVVLRLFYHDKAKLFFLLSGGLWLFSQFNIFKLDYPDGNIDLGTFNLFAWQFLFFSGLYIGFLKFSKKTVLPTTKKITILITSLIIGLFAVNMLTIFDVIFIPDFLINKSNLGILRITNFFAIAWAVDRLIISGNFPYSRWVAFLGRHSLQVFVFHIFFFYCAGFVEKRFFSDSNAISFLISIVAVLSLAIPAYLHQYASEKFPLIKKIGI